MSKLKSTIETSMSFKQHMLTKETRSKKLAWGAAIVMTAFAFLCIAAVIVMLPLKKSEIQLFSVDKQTGRTEFVSSVLDKDISTQEAMAKFFGANYVKLREGYNYFALQHDYDIVQLYSSAAVKGEYLAMFAGKEAPDKVYQNADYVVDTEIISNVITSATKPDMLDTIRLKKTIRSVQNGSVRTEIWNIRLTYHYIPSAKLSSSQRENNPLGYVVTSYQRDKELRAE